MVELYEVHFYSAITIVLWYMWGGLLSSSEGHNKGSIVQPSNNINSWNNISRSTPSTIQFFPNLSELVIIFIIWATPSEIWNKDKKEGALGVGNICLNTLFQRIEYEYSTIILES